MSGDHADWTNEPSMAPNSAPPPEKNEYREARRRRARRDDWFAAGTLVFVLALLGVALWALTRYEELILEYLQLFLKTGRI